jgi:DNA-binding response OmpR family regulator
VNADSLPKAYLMSLSAPITILLVEGEPLLLKYVRTILERAHFMVLSANTAESAIGIGQTTGTIHLLLSGVSMPGFSGIESAEQLEGRPGR